MNVNINMFVVCTVIDLNMTLFSPPEARWWMDPPPCWSLRLEVRLIRKKSRKVCTVSVNVKRTCIYFQKSSDASHIREE